MRMHLGAALIAASVSCPLFCAEPGIGLREVADSPVMMTDVRTKALFLQRVIRDDANRVSLLIMNPFGTKPLGGASAVVLRDGLVCVQVAIKNIVGTDGNPVYVLDATYVLTHKRDGAEQPITIVESPEKIRDRMQIVIGSDVVVLKLKLPAGAGPPEIECELAENSGTKAQDPTPPPPSK